MKNALRYVLALPAFAVALFLVSFTITLLGGSPTFVPVLAYPIGLGVFYYMLPAHRFAITLWLSVVLALLFAACLGILLLTDPSSATPHKVLQVLCVIVGLGIGLYYLKKEDKGG